jgi:hypothetical protein
MASEVFKKELKNNIHASRNRGKYVCFNIFKNSLKFSAQLWRNNYFQNHECINLFLSLVFRNCTNSPSKSKCCFFKICTNIHIVDVITKKYAQFFSRKCILFFSWLNVRFLRRYRELRQSLLSAIYLHADRSNAP